LEREALSRNRRGIILFTEPEDAQGDSGEAWDGIYSSRWEGQEARVEEEIAAVGKENRQSVAGEEERR